MSDFLVEFADYLVRPIGLTGGIILTGVLLSVWRRKTGLLVSGIGVLLLWFLATPLVGNTLLWTLERQYPPKAIDEIPKADAIVVLSGGVDPVPAINPNLRSTADRPWYASRLYHKDVASLVIATGGRSPGQISEAKATKRFLLDLGIPSDSVLFESRSRSTRENALYAAQICRERGLNRIALVTSADHMSRAVKVFRATGLEIVPAATDYVSYGNEITFLSAIPRRGGLSQSSSAFREYSATFYYWMRGWI